jgi:hypothetical protein
MNWELLFTEYWSHVTLLLAIVSYFIQRVLNLKSKKTEINHSLFQQNRINAVSDFMSSYSQAELMWRDIAVYEILSGKLGVKEIDEIIWPPLREMKKNVLILKLYFDIDSHRKFEIILDGFLKINTALQESYFDGVQKADLLKKSDEFHRVKNKILWEMKFCTE